MMDDKRFFDYLSLLNEDQLREVVLLPLLRRAGYQDVVHYHGPQEKGKDVICWYRDPVNERRYLAIVAKAGRIHGAVGKSGNASEVLNQVQQVFDEGYTDIYGLKDVIIDECWVVTSGEIVGSAIESIKGRLRKSNLDKFLKFVDAQRLVGLVRQHYPEFLNSELYFLHFLHEAKAVLAMIQGAAAHIRISNERQKADPERLNRCISDIGAGTAMLSKLFTGFRHLAVTPSQIRLERVSLDEVVQRLVANFRNSPSRRDITFEAASLARVPPLFVDREMMECALFNLMTNAHARAFPNSTVRLEFALHDAQIVIKVQNVGPPIPEGREEAFFAGAISDGGVFSRAGSPFDLMIARSLVERHGGKVYFTNRKDPTEISVFIPVKNPDHDSHS
jgi:signal transduction histidine kinase